ncbi:MAG: hypothetical protein ACREKE_00880, partial [bacterium]
MSAAMNTSDRPQAPLSLIGFMGVSLQWARLAVLGLCLLGVCLLQDPASADTLAPKDLWFAVALGFLPALGILRLWWDQPLRMPPTRVLGALDFFAGVATVSYFASPLAQVSRSVWQTWLLAALLLAASVDLFSIETGRLCFLRSLVIAAGLAGLRSVAQR